MARNCPAFKPERVIKALKRAGFYIHHVRGSHYILKKGKVRVTVPYHNKDLKTGTLAAIINQAGLSVEGFLDLV